MNPRIFSRAACGLLAVVTLTVCQLASAGAADAAGTRPIAPVVKTTASFCNGSTSKQRELCGLTIHVSQLSRYDSFVSCLGCGAGGWARWSKAGSVWSAKAASPIDARDTVLLVVTKPGQVGMYRVFRPIDVNTAHAGLKLARQGCVGADIPASSISTSFHHLLRNLPTIPCKRPKGLALVFTAGLNELSTSMTSHALIYGQTAKPGWLSVLQTTTASACRTDPLAYGQHLSSAGQWFIWHVKGQFEEGVRIQATHPTGRFCIYMQTGGRYHGLPDGWLSQWTYNDYGTGDVLTGPPTTALTAPGSTTVTLSGNAPRTETLESWDSLTPCSEYSEAAQAVSFGGSTMQVSGAFTETLTTGSFSQSGYICSYLHADGFTVAMATDQVSVAGTQLKKPATFAETAYQAITPVSDPVGDAGASGPGVAAGQTVDVRCIVNGLGLAPFDPVWYELASSPWGDAYYAPAYAFYNHGHTSGPATGAKLWDLAVPFCTTDL